MLTSKFEALGKPGREFFAVCDHDQNRFRLLVSVEQHVSDHFRRLLIEISGRLIAQQQLWFHDQRTCQSDALFLAA